MNRVSLSAFFLSCSILTAAAPASAQGAPAKAAEPAKPAAAKPAEPAKDAAKPAEAAKPADPAKDAAAELKAKREALKHYEKSAKCEGKMFKPDGAEEAMSFKMKGKAIADGAWIQTSKEWKKPAARKQEGFVGWDTALQTYRMTEVTSEGTLVACTSPGWSGDVMEWSCEGSMAGKAAKRRMTATKKGDKQVDTVAEAQAPDGSWKKMAESTCKM